MNKTNDINIFQENSIAMQKEFLLHGKPVVTLSGNEFSKKEGMTLTQQVVEYYNSIGNKAISPVYGEVVLDKKGVDDDFAHGVGRTKAVAFAAVPQIIENGIVILPFGKYKSDEKLLDGSSNPTLSLATNQGVMSEPFIGSSNPTSMLATNQGNIAKILKNILSAKSD